jgi:hypothetical protein
MIKKKAPKKKIEEKASESQNPESSIDTQKNNKSS